MMEWIKRRLRKFLGVDQVESRIDEMEVLYENLVSIGVDVRFNGEQSMILIYSRLKGGQIREIPVRFNNLIELNDLVCRLKREYKTSSETWDVPHRIRSFKDHNDGRRYY